MSLSDLAALGSFVSGVAVLASLAFLVLQSRYMVRNQQSLVHLSRTQMMQDVFESVSSPEMAEVTLKGNRGDLLTPSEHLRYSNAVWATFVYYENNFLQHRAGTLSDEQFEATLGSLKWQCLFPGMRACWIQSRGLFEKHFALFMDELVAKYPAVRDPTGYAYEAWTREAGKQVASAALSLDQVQL